jgi:D-alanyl-lipoteichoic acid acyltransferase DltB (MBOAT superfamily)
MAFNSLAYALLLTFAVAWMATGPWRALMLIVASLMFYAAAGPFDMLVFLGAVILNWLIQVAVPADRRRIVAAVIVNIGLIGYFKYRNMLLGEMRPPGSYINLALPLGISFYSFQALAYHIDVVRGRNGPARSFPEFFLFKAFFPQLIAGPIVRPNQTLPQIQRIFDDKWRRHRLVVFGLSLIVFGLMKKVVLADSLAPVVDDMSDQTAPISLGLVPCCFCFRSISISRAILILPSVRPTSWVFAFPGISRPPFWRPVFRSYGSAGTSR